MFDKYAFVWYSVINFNTWEGVYPYYVKGMWKKMGRKKEQEELGIKEKTILNFIEKEVREKGYPPSVR